MREEHVCSEWVDVLDFGHAYIVTLPISLFPKLFVPQALSFQQGFFENFFKQSVQGKSSGFLSDTYHVRQ